MINPNAKHSQKGIVTHIRRNQHSTDICVDVTMENGMILSELGFLYHKTLKLGDRVNCVVGFRIVGDRYGIESLRKCK